MGNQGNRSNYLAAFESANHQLEYIYSEYHELQRRKEKLESVLSALEPFMQGARITAPEFHYEEPVRVEPEPTYMETCSEPTPIPEPVIRQERFVEPIAPPAMAPAEEEIDPLQLRINRALGLAVA